MKTYRIRHWEENFENHESRKIKNTRFVSLTNAHDGKTYRRLTRHARGAEIFAAWVLMVQVASKMPIRGVLADNDGPLTAEDLELKTGFPEPIFRLALDTLSLPEYRWLDVEVEGAAPESPAESGDLPASPDAPGQSPGISRDVPASPGVPGCTEGTERNGTGRNGTEHSSGPGSDPTEEEADQVRASDVVAQWNALPEPFAKVKVLSDERRRKIKTRLSDPYWRDNWRKALERIPLCPFLRGESDGGWRAHFDWFVDNGNNLAKILEGQYDGAARKSGTAPQTDLGIRTDPKGRIAFPASGLDTIPLAPAQEVDVDELWKP